MEPVTHFLTGACIGRAGLNRKTAYATLAADARRRSRRPRHFWGLRGPVEGLKHHRGITHTFIAVPVVAAVIVGIVGCSTSGASDGASASSPAHQRSRRAHSLACSRARPLGLALSHAPSSPPSATSCSTGPTTTACVHSFPSIRAGMRAASCSSPSRCCGRCFLLACIMPWLLGLADQRNRRAPQRRFAAAAGPSSRSSAWSSSGAGAGPSTPRPSALLENTQVTSAPVTRAGPRAYPVNPFRWHAILETAGLLSDRRGQHAHRRNRQRPAADVLYKPADTPAVEAAKRTPLGKVYLDWGTWAVVRDVGQQPVRRHGPAAARRPTAPGPRSSSPTCALPTPSAARAAPRRPPGLSGWVYIIDNHEDAGEGMGGREQK